MSLSFVILTLCAAIVIALGLGMIAAEIFNVILKQYDHNAERDIKKIYDRRP